MSISTDYADWSQGFTPAESAAILYNPRARALLATIERVERIAAKYESGELPRKTNTEAST